MTFSSPQIIRAKAEASLEQAQTAFWFPVLPGLQALPSTPTITTNATPAPANAVAVPAGFNFDNPDLADLFENILPKGQAPVFPRTMGPAAGLIVPPYNEIQRWEARIRVPAEATLLPFSNEITYLAALTLKVRVPSAITDRLGESSRVLTLSGTAIGTVFTPPVVGTSVGTLAISGTATGVVFTPQGSTATLAITGTAAGGVRVTGAASTTLAITGTATGTVAAASSPHLYWRINGIDVAAGGSFFEVSELRVFVNGSDVTSSATVTSSSAPENLGLLSDLTDNSTSTRCYWTAATAEDSAFWIKYTFASAQSVNGVKQAGFDTNDRYAQGFTLQWSDDNSAWTTLGSKSGLSYPGNNTLSSLYSFP